LQDLPHFRVDRLSPCSYGCGAHPSRSFYQELILNYLTVPLKVLYDFLLTLQTHKSLKVTNFFSGN
jgi:hypothetical protein